MEMNAGSKSSEMPFNPESKEMTIPQVQVIENGQVIDPNRIRPDVMQFIMLAKMTRDITRIKNIIEDQESSGETYSWNETITDARVEYVLVQPAISIAADNRGPDEVKVWINSLGRTPHLVPRNRILNIDFNGHKLIKLFAQCNPGETATLRCNFKE